MLLLKIPRNKLIRYPISFSHPSAGTDQSEWYIAEYAELHSQDLRPTIRGANMAAVLTEDHRDFLVYYPPHP